LCRKYGYCFAVVAYYKVKFKTVEIIRSNHQYFKNTIQAKDELLSQLTSAKCITIEQADAIRKLALPGVKNSELVHMLRSFDDQQLQEFIRCLRKTGQLHASRVLRNGGGIVSFCLHYFFIVSLLVAELLSFSSPMLITGSLVR
jgi:hypothetical protein